MAAIIIFNTLSRKKELFRPLRKGQVGLYTCGPTVYNFVHIGNLRTYIFEDLLRRTFEYAGYNVKHVMNTTDVDDKTILASSAAGVTLKDFTRKFEKLFLQDTEKLNIKPPVKLARATEHIREMTKLVHKLLKNRAAYEKDDSVYFDISKFKPYGKLARLDIKGLKAGARVDTDEYKKDAVQDFALWKGAKKGEPAWQAPFSNGRPGWHIECSAMSMKYLGSTFDIHAGGVDLIFPHHENEIAQSEAATGKKFVRYWIHGEHLLVNGKKMSKSLGNIFTLRDVEQRGFEPLAYRYLVLTSHYRSKLNFTWESLTAAQGALNRLYDFTRRLGNDNNKGKTTLTPWNLRFESAFRDDLNSPKALAVVWDLIRRYNRKPHEFDSRKTLSLFYEFDEIIGLNWKEEAARKNLIPKNIQELAEKREKLRKEKKWQEADEIREGIEETGFSIKDTSEGPQIKKKPPR